MTTRHTPGVSALALIFVCSALTSFASIATAEPRTRSPFTTSATLAHAAAQAQTPTGDLEAQIKAMQAEMATGKRADDAPATAAAQNDAAISVKVLHPVVSIAGSDGESVADAVEAAIVARLSREPQLRVTPSARPGRANADAATYTLAISIAKKSKGGLFSKIPIGSLPLPRVVSKFPVGPLQAAMQAIKAKDRVSFHYAVLDSNQRSLADATFEVTAAADGYDVWSSGVAKLAEAVVPLISQAR